MRDTAQQFAVYMDKYILVTDHHITHTPARAVQPESWACKQTKKSRPHAEDFKVLVAERTSTMYCVAVRERTRWSERKEDKWESYPEPTLLSFFHYTLYPLPLRETATESFSILWDEREWRDSLYFSPSLYLSHTHTQLMFWSGRCCGKGKKKRRKTRGREDEWAGARKPCERGCSGKNTKDKEKSPQIKPGGEKWENKQGNTAQESTGE